jgi:membrane peptidoglycan carboxypeptidase
VFRRIFALFKLLSLCVVAGLLLAGVTFPVFGGLGLVSNRATAAVGGISSQLAAAEVPLMTTIQDMNGNPIAYLYDQYRVPTPSKQISPNMKAAIVAVEDKRFYQHNGVDWQGVGRALVANQLKKQTAEGASTLTQQYVKNYLAFVVTKNQQGSAAAAADYQTATARTTARKLREIRIALQLEKQLTKDEILTDYLNTVPFGNHAFGIGAAARTYFNTTPDKLTLAQAATLSGLVNSPSYLDPGSNPDDALKRRNLVLADLADPNGLLKDDVASQHAALEAEKEPLGVVSPLNWPPSGCVGANGSSVTGFFCQYVIDYLKRYGHLSTSVLMRGGYTIKTTLDPQATQAAKKAAEDQVPKTTDGIANVMAVVQPGKDKHRVRALVANRDFGTDASRGQTGYALPSIVIPFGTGSTYKIFTTAAAMEQGKAKLSTVLQTPTSYTSHVFKGGANNCESAGGSEHWYCLQNASTKYPPQMTLQEALASSPNTGFVQLEEQAGVPAAVDMAVRLGLRDSMQSTAQGNQVNPGDMSQAQTAKASNGTLSGSFTLGVSATSPLELANVDATIMSGGTWCPPTPIDQVVDRNGKPVQINEPPCDQAVDTPLANSLAQGLSKDVISGTAAAAAKAAGWNRETIGKTGTTENNQSAAFVAATPYMAGAVLAYADGNSPGTICVRPTVSLCKPNQSSYDQIFGGAVPAATWFEAMNVIHQNVPPQPLPPVDPRYQ